MASWTSMGHAMRRRMGAPSNHHEAAGKSMNKDLSPEQVIASGARAYMGSEAGSFTSPSAKPTVGKLMPKKNTQAADPTAGGKANRTNMLAGNAVASERMGARHRISVKFPAGTEPAAAETMANGRMISSVAGRQAPNFNDGNSSSY